MRTRAAILSEMGLPRPYTESQPLRVVELDLAPPGPGEVLVELAAAGLCHSDLSTINASRPRPMPMVLGHEASGIVREIGPGVEGFQADDHVVFSFVPMCGHCEFCNQNRPALCDVGVVANTAGTLLRGGVRFERNGEPVLHHLGVSGFSQFTVAVMESLVKVESNVPLELAALFGCAILTGVGSIVNTAAVKPGQSVAVMGLGGVGLSAVMGARLCGASPIIAVDPISSKRELAKRLGADHVIDPTTVDTVTAIADLTRGGVDFAVEAVGSAAAIELAYAIAKRGGSAISVGLAHPEQRVSVAAVTFAAQEKSIRGSYMGSAVPKRDVPRLIGLYQAGKLPVDELLSPSISLDDINLGFERLAEGSVVRQLVHFA